MDRIVKLGILLITMVGGTLLASYFTRWAIGGSPWQVTFQRSSSGTLDMSIENDTLGIKTAWIRSKIPLKEGFQAGTVVLVTGKEGLPLGSIVFFDATVPPGRVKLSIDQHMIDIMPRGLILDKSEYSWAEAEKGVDLPLVAEGQGKRPRD